MSKANAARRVGEVCGRSRGDRLHRCRHCQIQDRRREGCPYELFGRAAKFRESHMRFDRRNVWDSAPLVYDSLDDGDTVIRV